MILRSETKPPRTGSFEVEKHSAIDGLARVAAHLAEGDEHSAAEWLRRALDASDSYADWLAAAGRLAAVRACSPSPRANRLKVWVCNSSTTVQFSKLLALAGFRLGLDLVVENGAYGQFQQEILDPQSALYAAHPDIVVLALDAGAVHAPAHAQDPERQIDGEVDRWRELWRVLSEHSRARLVVHNFAIPPENHFGHLAVRLPGARVSVLAQINARLGALAGDSVSIVDCDRLSSLFGKARWFSARYRHLCDQACSFEALPTLARHTAAVIAAGRGLSKKCLVLDLDNTLWGGVVGEDGVGGIRIGQETAQGRAHKALQLYLKSLKDRGILLAVCSKNDLDLARAPFLEREEMALRLDDFASFRANWDGKHENIRAIAQEIGIGLDAMVFMDDNPAEREIVRQMVPEVEVLALPSTIDGYVAALDTCPWFEPASFTREDEERTSQYRSNIAAAVAKRDAPSVADFLQSLDMEAVLEPIGDENARRVAQLLSKTNQFNLTSRRLNYNEVCSLAKDPQTVHLAVRLRDRFTDHGLVGVAAGSIEAGRFDIDTLAISCRVIGRTLEHVLVSELIEAARKRQCAEVVGVYAPTGKNGSVADLYPRFGFDALPTLAGEQRRFLMRIEDWRAPENFIRVYAGASPAHHP